MGESNVSLEYVGRILESIGPMRVFRTDKGDQGLVIVLPNGATLEVAFATGEGAVYWNGEEVEAKGAL